MENTTSLRTFSWNKKKGKPLPPTTEANLFFTRAKNREGTQVGRETKQSTRDFQFYVRVFILHGWNAVAEHTERCYRAATFQPSPAFSSSLCDKNFFHGLFAEERCERLSLSLFSAASSSFPWRDRVIDVPTKWPPTSWRKTPRRRASPSRVLRKNLIYRLRYSNASENMIADLLAWIWIEFWIESSKFSLFKIKREIKQMLNFLLNRNCHVYKHELTVLIHHCITISWKASLCLSFCCVQCACRFSHTWPPVSYPLLICPSLSWKGDSCGRFMFIRHTVTAPWNRDPTTRFMDVFKWGWVL